MSVLFHPEVCELFELILPTVLHCINTSSKDPLHSFIAEFVDKVYEGCNKELKITRENKCTRLLMFRPSGGTEEVWEDSMDETDYVESKIRIQKYTTIRPKVRKYFMLCVEFCTNREWIRLSAMFPFSQILRPIDW